MMSRPENYNQEIVDNKPSNNNVMVIGDNKEDNIAFSKIKIRSKNENDKSQENLQESNSSEIGGVESQKEPTKTFLMSRKEMFSSDLGTTNMSLVKALNHSFLTTKEIGEEKSLLDTAEKERLAKLFPSMISSFPVSSTLAISPPECVNIINTPLPGNNDEYNIDGDNDDMKEDDDLNSLLPMMPPTPTSNDKYVAMNFENEGLKFPHSPTGVTDNIYQETGNMDLSLAQDDFLLKNTNQHDRHHQLNIPSLTLENNQLSIENQHILINGLIARSLSETITLMGNMRHQSQKIQQQLKDLGVLPCKPLLKLKSEVEDVCANDHNIFASWQPPLLPTGKSIRQHKRRRASGKETFPMKLHRLLLDLEHVNDGSSIATFLPGGSAFVIKDTCKFEKTVLKMYFPRMKNFSSFHRQLNLYDFERLGSFAPAGQAKGAYSHALFHRDQSSWAKLMRPTRIKGGTSAAASQLLRQKQLSNASSQKELLSCSTKATN